MIESDMKPKQFKAWRKRNGLSMRACETAIDRTKQMILEYEKGTRPIPLIVKLACVGYETLNPPKG